MEQDDLILGRVNLNGGKDECSPIIELLDWDGVVDGEIVVLQVKKVSKQGKY